MTDRARSIAHPEASSAEPATGRYHVVGELGGGGMARVFAAVDATTGRRVALKRPEPDLTADQKLRAQALFEREFHTLAQLAHPRIVAVYDYGVDDHGPYYTMELLDGGDLQHIVPADYRRVCAIARDVCSALSLLHSRRIVHRDISPRNIRCTADGTAKVIDFGAMTPMGNSRDLVGTPAYCPPEMLHLQALDARTDLYALGATMYYAITGRHAYPAREFASLPSSWHFEVVPPSALVPDVPAALDALILQLLQLDCRNRPSNAAEVMERLAAIEGRPVDEQLLVAQAYLSTPAFVGREAELEQVGARIERALRARGSALLVSGEAGVGRTRFLDSVVLAAKLRGMIVLRAGADDAERGDYGVLRALMSQLARAMPEPLRALTPSDRTVLEQALPELGADHESAVPTPAAEASREALQNAVVRLLLAAAAQGPLCLAIDDLHRADEPSAAVLALSARALRDAALLIVSTGVGAAAAISGSAYAVYAAAASSIALPSLEFGQVTTLLESVFGTSPQLEQLARRLNGVAHGNPRDVMRLAQHLLDTGVVRYDGGAWSLPSQIDTTDLPTSIAQMLRARVQVLEPSACWLACAFALSPDRGFSAAECASLTHGGSTAQRFRDLEELTKAEILHDAGERFVLTDRAWIPALLAERSDPAELRALHLSLARLFEAHEHESFRVAQNLLRADEPARALDLLVNAAIASQQLTDRDPAAFADFIRSLPEDWLDTFDEAIALCEALHRPPKHAFVLRNRLAGLVAVIGLRETKHLRVLIAQLTAACGLDDWAALDPAFDPLERLQRALGAAQVRYEATPEVDRVVEPLTAIRLLAGAIQAGVGTCAPLFDVAGVRALPSLAPMAALSPALLMLDKLVQGVLARITGRLDRARLIYRELIERTSAPDMAGLSASHHRHMRIRMMSGLALIEASMGLSSALDWASKIEADPLYRVYGALIRVVYRLWQGESQEAERSNKDLEALRLRSGAAQQFEHTHLVWQLAAYAAMDDLTRLKRTMDAVAAVAADHPGWQPVLAYARIEYQRVRGDSASALSLLTDALNTVRPGEHQLWPNLAGAHVRSLDEAGRTVEAAMLGAQYLADADRADLGLNANYILLPLCAAEAKLDLADAVEHAERAIDACERLGATGLHLGLAFEARARVALAKGDRAACDVYVTRCEDVFGTAAESALAAKVYKLKRDAQRCQMAAESAGISVQSQPQPTAATTMIQTRLRDCCRAPERAELMLSLLAEHSGATRGVLYLFADEGPVWAATLGSEEPSYALTGMVREYLASALEGRDASTGDAETHSEFRTEWSSFGDAKYRPVLLSHYTADGCVITGLAVFRVAPHEAFVYPADAAAQVSLACQQAGDAVGHLVPD